MTGNKADAVRIQTSILNAAEKKILVWLAERQPRWMTSDILTYIGVSGAVMIAAGYMLSSVNIRWLWFSSLGFAVNWYGDSLDGTLARVRGHQRPVYGYYLDHTVDAINEFIMVLGIGLSGLMHLDLALIILAFYFMLTINVSINAHLKKEFRLTYANLGPTEFRIIMVIVNTLFILVPALNSFSHEFKTPIVSIRGFAKQLERDDLTEEQRMEYIDIIEEEKAAKEAAKTAAPEAPAKKKKLTYKEQKELEQLEKDLEALAAEKADLEEKLNSGSLPYEELQKASERIGEIMELTDEKELRWLELSENL